MSGLKIVSVVNNFEIFDRCIKGNEFLKNAEIIVYDNTVENIGIAERYNTFIDTIKESDDFWVAFIHQDFIFCEDLNLRFKNMDKNSIYGAIGVRRSLFFLQLFPKLILRIFRRRVALGRIYEGEGDRTVGNIVKNQPKVTTLDCCCCIVHSSLFKKKKLMFDENLKFHMYVEDFCHTAKKRGVASRVLQLNCRHLSGGCQDEEFERSVKYVKAKHKIRYISSTCCE